MGPELDELDPDIRGSLVLIEGVRPKVDMWYKTGPGGGAWGREGLPPVMIGDSRIEGRFGRPPPEKKFKVKTNTSRINKRCKEAHLVFHIDDLLEVLTVSRVSAHQDFRNDLWEINFLRLCSHSSESY